MPYATYAVQSFERATRRVLAVHAEGLTMRAASNLAAALRAADAENDEAVGYALATLPLSRQIELAEAAGLILAAADPAPHALAA